MFPIKNSLMITALIMSGLLLFSSQAFPLGGGQKCGNQSFDKSKLSKEQINKIDEMQDKYNKETLPLRQKLNLLRTEAYNYGLNDNIDVENVKQFRQQIRDVQGKIDDLKIDETAGINKILPKDQQIDLKSYLNQYADNTSCGMMNKKGMMGSGMHGMMMKNMMNGSGMMQGKGSCNKMGGSGMMSGDGSNQ